MSTRVLIALDVPDADAADPVDLIASVRARLFEEAGYLDPDGRPIVPDALTLVVAGEAFTTLTENELAGIYNVGLDGLPEDDGQRDPDDENICGLCGTKRAAKGATACSDCA